MIWILDTHTIAMCAQPIGNLLYGFLLEVCEGYEAAIVLFAGVISLMLAVSTKKIFKQILP